MDNSLADQISSERSFLHEMSNQLVIAQGMTNFVVSAFERKGVDETDKERVKLEKALRSLNKMIGLLRERREELIHKDIPEVICLR